MNAKYFAIHSRRQWQVVENVNKSLPEPYVIMLFAFLVEAQLFAAYILTLMGSS